MAAYIGDVLSYYADTNLKESFIQQATERANVYELSKALGYNIKNSVNRFSSVKSTYIDNNCIINFKYKNKGNLYL